MAEEKAPSGPNGHDFALMILILFVVVSVFATVLERKGLSDIFNLNDLEEISSGEVNIEGAILKSDLDLGDDIVNIKGAIVRQVPGGQALGRQNEGERGRLVEGPVERFDILWWRVDYADAPDGWVEGQLVSNRVGSFTVLNIFPIVVNFLKPFLIIVSIILLLLIINFRIKMRGLSKIDKKKEEVKAEKEIWDHKHEETEEEELPIPGLPVGEKPTVSKPSNRRWENIQSLMKSYNVNDWKQAIIEADTILDEMLERMGYKGAGVGERLKQVEHSDFITLNQAWEAHKVRNRVAHAGVNFVLSKDEAERVIRLYSEVFSEFFYI